MRDRSIFSLKFPMFISAFCKICDQLNTGREIVFVFISVDSQVHKWVRNSYISEEIIKQAEVLHWII